MDDAFDELAFDAYFGLLSVQDLVVVRPYMGDDDDRVLEEVRPRYVVMYEPDPAFVRRVEVRLDLWGRCHHQPTTVCSAIAPRTRASASGSTFSSTAPRSKSKNTSRPSGEKRTRSSV